MDYFERIGEECGFGTQLEDRFLWFDGDCQAMLARVRREALEEAAKVCDAQASVYEAKRDQAKTKGKDWDRREDQREVSEWLAAAIRALISPEPKGR